MPTIEEIRQVIVPILLQDAKELKRVVLFGSYARNEATADSDIDVYLDGTLLYRFDDTKDTAERASAALSVPVEIITRPALQNSVISASFQAEIERDGIILYE